MRRFLLLSLLAVVLLGVTSCGGNRTKNDGLDKISSMLKEAINEAKSSDDSLNATEDTLAQADSEAVKKSDAKGKVVVIDFFATWCGPCRAMAPAMEKMEQKYSDKIEFRKVDIDKNRSLAQKYEIEAVPTLVILSPKGEVINKVVGGQSEDFLDRMFGSL